MPYVAQTLGANKNSGSEGIIPTAKQLSNLDQGLVDHEARIVALLATVAALDARVVVLETP